MAIFSASVFSSTVYKTNEVPDVIDVRGVGGIFTHTKKEAKKEKEAIDIIEEALAELRSYEQTPKSAFLSIKEKSQKNQFLQTALVETIPHDFAYITELQLEQILSQLTKRYLERRRIIQEEEIMLALLTY
jgi:hypothetical protein